MTQTELEHWHDRAVEAEARIAELEAERDEWQTTARNRAVRITEDTARIEHLEAALREALSHIPQANTLKPHYERENVVREILERALTTSTQEDA